jgi:hypothetical protein
MPPKLEKMAGRRAGRYGDRADAWGRGAGRPGVGVLVKIHYILDPTAVSTFCGLDWRNKPISRPLRRAKVVTTKLKYVTCKKCIAAYKKYHLGL